MKTHRLKVMSPDEHLEQRLGCMEDRLDAIVAALHEIGKALGIKEQLEAIGDRLAKLSLARHSAPDTDADELQPRKQ